MDLFGTEHLIYIFTSIPIAILLAVGGMFIKNKKWQALYIWLFALATNLVHYSTMYVIFFKSGGGHSIITADQLFPIYFCNFLMILDFIAICLYRYKSRFMNVFFTFCAYGGTLGALITVFSIPPGVAEWGYFQSAISHSLMLVTSLLFFTCGYVKINVYNVVPVCIGLLVCGAVGGSIELLYYTMGLKPANAMFLISGPSGGLEAFTGLVLFPMILGVVFIFSYLFDLIKNYKNNPNVFKNLNNLDLYIHIKRAATNQESL